MGRTRREVLGLLGASAGTVLLAACGQAAPTPTATTPPAAPKPTEAPKSTAAAQTPAAAAKPTETSKPVAAASPTAETAKPTTAPKPAGPTPEPTPVQSTLAPKSGKVTIEIWHAYGGGVGRDVLLKMLADFNSKTGIGINESRNADSSDARVHQKFVAATAAGSGPDVYNNTAPVIWGGRGTLHPLDEYIARDKFDFSEKEWFPVAQFRAKFEGKVYGLPYNTDSRAMFWNKKDFTEAGLDPEKPPKTWSELKAAAQKLQKKDGNRIVRAGFSPLYGQTRLESFVGSGGGYPMIDWSTTPPKARFNSPGAIKALEYMLDLTELLGGVTQLRSFQEGFQTGASEPFLTGQVSIMWNGSWYPATIRQYKPDMQYGRDYGIAAQPYLDDGGKVHTLASGWSFSVAKVAKNKDQAWEFVRWFCEDPQMLWWNRDNDNVPTRYKVAQDPVFQEGTKKIFMDLMPSSDTFPIGPWTTAPKYTLANAQDEVLFKKRSATEALTQANDEMQKVIAEYYTSR